MQNRSTSVLVYATVVSASTTSHLPQPQPQATANSDWIPAQRKQHSFGRGAGGSSGDVGSSCRLAYAAHRHKAELAPCASVPLTSLQYA